MKTKKQILDNPKLGVGTLLWDWEQAKILRSHGTITEADLRMIFRRLLLHFTLMDGRESDLAVVQLQKDAERIGVF